MSTSQRRARVRRACWCIWHCLSFLHFECKNSYNWFSDRTFPIWLFFLSFCWLFDFALPCILAPLSSLVHNAYPFTFSIFHHTSLKWQLSHTLPCFAEFFVPLLLFLRVFACWSALTAGGLSFFFLLRWWQIPSTNLAIPTCLHMNLSLPPKCICNCLVHANVFLVPFSISVPAQAPRPDITLVNFW